MASVFFVSCAEITSKTSVAKPTDNLKLYCKFSVDIKKKGSKGRKKELFLQEGVSLLTFYFLFFIFFVFCFTNSHTGVRLFDTMVYTVSLNRLVTCAVVKAVMVVTGKSLTLSIRILGSISATGIIC